MSGYLSFTGQSGCYAELPLEVLAGATTFTIEAKISTTSAKSSSNNWTWGTIAGREIGGHWQDDFGFCVNNGKLCFWAEPISGGSSSTNNTTSNAVVNDGAIHDVAVVSSNGAIDLYCDGVSVAHTDNVNAKISSAQTILLSWDSNDNSYLKMNLYELRCWSVARSSAEIAANISGNEAGLEGWYKPSADGLQDYSGNSRHATLYGSPAYVPEGSSLWTQPVLTANGTIGQGDFAVASGGGAESDAYKAFDNSASSYVNKMNSGAWLEFYSRISLTISDIVITSEGSLPSQGVFQVSNDSGETWVEVGSWQDTDGLGESAHVVFDDGTVTGKYFRFVSQGKSLAKPNNNADFSNVVITATYDKSSYFQSLVDNLVVWLPFDNSTTEDLCGNEWTATDSPTISETNAINGKALQLDGSSYLQLDGEITLGGQDFTICGRAKVDTSNKLWYPGLFSFNNKQLRLIGVGENTDRLIISIKSSESTITNLNIANIFHYEIDYTHSNGVWRLFINGTQVFSKTASLSRTTYSTALVGSNGDSSTYDGMNWSGTIDEFQIYDGIALHTANFTPPTAQDYRDMAEAMKPSLLTVDVERRISNVVEVTADVERKVIQAWRYVNLGDADDLILDAEIRTDLDGVTKTGTAFYQTEQEKCFDIPATDEIWIKFDVFFDGHTRWRAYNGGVNGVTGITAQESTQDEYGVLSLFANGTFLQNTEGVCEADQLQTVLLHMISGSSAGVIEAWVDGEKIYTYTGNVNHGADFADIYLQSDDQWTFFSNVIISNRKIGLNDGYQECSCDVERKLKNAIEFTADVEKILIVPIIVSFIGEHFNHYVPSVKLYYDKPQKIILPKKSEVFIRATGDGAIRIFSDVDIAGKRINSEKNLLDGELAECEVVFVQSKNTAKRIIRRFFSRYGKFGRSNQWDEIGEAVNFATEGKFQRWQSVFDKFMSDLNSAENYTDFLENCCGIILDNEDTGAVTGADAGGNITKTAASVVPEETAPANWIVPEAGSTVTINGLNVVFPSNDASGDGFTAAEEHIMAGLNSEWIKQSLDLVEESFGLSFNDEEAATRTITVSFEYKTNSSRTAGVSYTNRTSTNKFSDLQLIINMAYYSEIDASSEDGLLVPYSSRYYTAGYLDRVIAHEMTHAVMASVIPNFERFPEYIQEGAAELVHGIDDLRSNAIIELLTTKKSYLNYFSESMGASESGFVSPPPTVYLYAGGYLFLRYIGKQAGDEIPTQMIITDLFIGDGGTGQEISLDVLRTLIKSVAVNFDVEIEDVFPVNFTADVSRAILAKLRLFPIDNSIFFGGD